MSVEQWPAPMVGKRIMTLARQRSLATYAQEVARAISENRLDTKTLENLRRSGEYLSNPATLREEPMWFEEGYEGGR